MEFTNLNFSLPVFHTEPFKHSPLSMDEFDQFVEEDLNNSFDREAYKKEKLLRSVPVKFEFDEKK